MTFMASYITFLMFEIPVSNMEAIFLGPKKIQNQENNVKIKFKNEYKLIKQ